MASKQSEPPASGATSSALVEADITPLWAHPICEVDVATRFGIDNDRVASYCERIASTELTDTRWDCEIISSFRDDDVNRQLEKDLGELYRAFKTIGNEFAELVGWSVGDTHEYVPSKMWFNLYLGRHWQEKHNHVTHNIAAVYFVTTDTAPTTFFNPNLESLQGRFPKRKANRFNRELHTVKPEAGKLVVFPGYLNHSVPYRDQPEDKVQKRLTVAANFDGRRRDTPGPKLRHLIDV